MDVRTAIVTGAASGIGALAVARMRSRGVRVLAADRSPAIHQQHSDDDGVVTVAGDVTSAELCHQLVRRTEDTYGPVDRLVHCAGIMPGGAIIDTATEDILHVMAVNYAGTVRMTKAVLPPMRARSTGQIIVLGSLTGYVPSQRLAAYSASKAAVNAYVEALAHEERGHGIHVLLVAPSAVKTPLLAQATGGPRMIERLNRAASSPLMITPEKVLDDIDRALARHRSMTLPGGRLIHTLRRLSPTLMWTLADRLDRGYF
jgi:NAD(P)-dependent dehydrogenase (short-subunit alcohol dehydrogenase family)